MPFCMMLLLVAKVYCVNAFALLLNHNCKCQTFAFFQAQHLGSSLTSGRSQRPNDALLAVHSQRKHSEPRSMDFTSSWLKRRSDSIFTSRRKQGLPRNVRWSGGVAAELCDDGYQQRGPRGAKVTHPSANSVQP